MKGAEMNGNVFLAISEVTAVEVHVYAFKDVLSAHLWEE